MAGQLKKSSVTPNDTGSGTSVASSESVSDKVASAILRDIRLGRLVPGQHLLEPELTGRLKISRGSLREALKHLAAAGIVNLTRFRGAYIATLDRKSVFDLLDTLEPLACLGARLAAENRIGEPKGESILAAAKRLEEVHAGGNRGEYLNERRRFYDIMMELGGNNELARAIPLSRTDLFRAQVETRQSEKQRKLHASGYSKIAEAIARGDINGASKAMAMHIDGTRDTMRDLPVDVFPSESN